MAGGKDTFSLDASSAAVKADTYGAFITGKVDFDISSVPGVGPAMAAVFRSNGVLTTVQLLGQFMVMHDPTQSVQEHCDAFYRWLKGIGITHGRAAITRAVAEKCNVFVPGLFDPDACAK